MNARRAHITIERMKRTHLEDALEVVVDAFKANPLANAVFPSTPVEKRVPKLRRVYGGALSAALLFGRGYVVRRGGRVVAVAITYPPEHFPLPLGAKAMQTAAATSLGPIAMSRYAKHNRVAMSLHPAVPHWFVYFVGVLSTYHGKGYGSALVNHINKLSDADKHPGFLQTPLIEQVEYYRQFGYEVTEEVEVKGLKDFKLYSMLRKPATRKRIRTRQEQKREA